MAGDCDLAPAADAVGRDNKGDGIVVIVPIAQQYDDGGIAMVGVSGLVKAELVAGVAPRAVRATCESTRIV
jgi:hypothetical protein